MRKFTCFFMAALLLTALVTSAGASMQWDIFDYMAGYLEGDRDEAYKLLRPLALQGDAEAQFKLGVIYALSIPRDLNRAAYWWARAAERGHIAARSHLKEILQCCEDELREWDGYVLKYRATQKVITWQRKAAESGNYLAQLLLSRRYAIGDGVNKEPGKAKYWLHRAVQQTRKAAEKGDVRARAQLGYLYLKGEGVERDKQKAQYWFDQATEGLRKAADQGNAEAAYKLACIYNTHGYGAFGPQLVPEDPAKSVYWYVKAAELGCLKAMGNLFDAYLYGDRDDKAPVRLDRAKAKYWFCKYARARILRAQQGDGDSLLWLIHYKDAWDLLQWVFPDDWTEWHRIIDRVLELQLKAAKKGNLQAQLTLVKCYSDWGLDDKEAWIRLLTSAAEQGDKKSQTTLGECYLRGQRVIGDISKALYWLRKAADQGNCFTAQYLLAEAMEATAENFEKQMHWLIRHADLGSTESQLLLGLIYEEGRGVPVDLVKAYMWYDLASEKEEARSSRDRVAKKMTPAQMAEAKRLIIEWMQKE